MKLALLLALLLLAACTVPAGAPAPAASGAATPTVAAWPLYDIPDAGITFAYPPDSKIEGSTTVQPGLPPVLTLYVPADRYPGGNVLSLGIAGYEFPDDTSLADWVKMWYGVGEITADVLSTTPVDLPGGEQALLATVSYGFEQHQALFFPHGNLMIWLSGPDTAAMLELLPTIAASMQFASDAPDTLAELYGQPWNAPTLAQVYAERQAALAATPPPSIVETDAATATAVARAVTPGPSATYPPAMQTAEAEHYAGLATAAAQLTPPTPTHTHAPTATPIPGSRPGFVRYEGASIYQELPRFQVEYEASQWQIEGTLLRHRLLPDCALQLAAGGRGAAGPAIVEWEQLGEYEWEATALPTERMISYALQLPAGYFLMFAQDAALSAEQVHTACRSAAETVIATFTLLEP